MRALIVGCGYLGLALGRLLREHRHDVFGTRRSPAATDELREAGITPLIADVTQPGSLETLPAPFDWIVNTVSSGGGGKEAYREVYLGGTMNLLAWLQRRPPAKFVFTSSTSVYGQDDGSIVTEKSPAEGASETSRILRATEDLLLTAARDHGFPSIVLRLAGLYGAGRGHLFHEFLAGRAQMHGDGSRWLNMIHRDDAAGAILAALERGRIGEVYNVADKEGVSEVTFYRWLAGRFDRPVPPPGPERPPDRKRGATNKRVSNRKLREELGWQPRFPTFREGYAAEGALASGS